MIVVQIIKTKTNSIREKELLNFETELDYDLWFENYKNNLLPNYKNYDVTVLIFN